jgi:protein TonB
VSPGGVFPGPLRITSGVRPPTKLRHVQPEYPDLARRAGLSGNVLVECLIDATGAITEVRVVSGSPLLAPAAAAAVRQWRYSPTLLGGVPVPVLLTVTVRFDLRR